VVSFRSGTLANKPMITNDAFRLFSTSAFRIWKSERGVSS
jgi:hypothetical protein